MVVKGVIGQRSNAFQFISLLFSPPARHPRSLNQQDRSNSAPNVCINNVKSSFGIDQQRAGGGAGGNGGGGGGSSSSSSGAASSGKSMFQSNQEHSHSTQASPTNTLKHVKRQRARSADESNKNLLTPRDPSSNEENWVSEVRRRSYFCIYILCVTQNVSNVEFVWHQPVSFG